MAHDTVHCGPPYSAVKWNVQDRQHSCCPRYVLTTITLGAQCGTHKQQTQARTSLDFSCKMLCCGKSNMG